MMNSNGENAYNSTYQETYKPPAVLPPIIYHQPPGLDLSHVRQLQPRQFPVIPCGPHRRVGREHALGPGLGTEDLATEQLLDRKPIVKTVPPREITTKRPSSALLRRRKSAKGVRRSAPVTEAEAKSVHPITKDIFGALCDSVTWTSTTRQATEEAKIPIHKVDPPTSTFEQNADVVKYRPMRYENEAGEWQRVAALMDWDRAQTRPRIDRPIDPTVQLSPSKLLPKRCNKAVRISVGNHITNLISQNNLSASYERPCPGYAGFVPRNPIEAPCEKQAVDPSMVTVMKQSYRSLPSDDYHIRTHAHKGPMSRTVTLTYPYNPFNKVEGCS